MITWKLKNINKLKYIPILLRFSIAKDLAAFSNPSFFPCSKHPFTVNVSNPKELDKRNLSDSEDIIRSGSEDVVVNSLEKISINTIWLMSSNFIAMFLNIDIGLRFFAIFIKYLLLFLNIRFWYALNKLLSSEKSILL